MSISAQRALVTASFVVAGVAAFFLAYLFIGARPGPSRPVPSQAARLPAAVGAAEAAARPGAAPDDRTPAPTSSTSHAAWQPGPGPLVPSPVGSLRLASNTMTDFTVAWDPAVDDSGIRCYRVLMNGFLADTTSATQARLGWLAGKHPILIQVAAVDSDGNYGPWSALYVIPPPDPATVPAGAASSTTPSPTEVSTSPTASTSAAASPSAATSGAASASATTTPTATATASGPSSASPSPTPSSPSPTPTPTPTPTPSATPGL